MREYVVQITHPGLGHWQVPGGSQEEGMAEALRTHTLVQSPFYAPGTHRLWPRCGWQRPVHSVVPEWAKVAARQGQGSGGHKQETEGR